MKPPVDWSPCQQKGEEHDWKYNLIGSMVACSNCGVVVYTFALAAKEAEKDAGMGSLGESPRTA